MFKKYDTIVQEFKGEFRWLSNFWPCDISYGGLIFPSVENAYQASKFSTDEERLKFIQISSGHAKRLGKSAILRNSWDREKVGIMRSLLIEKFRNETLKCRLLDTNGMLLEEGNNWKDTFWGVDLNTGKGSNILGKLIMEIRDGINRRTVVDSPD